MEEMLVAKSMEGSATVSPLKQSPAESVSSDVDVVFETPNPSNLFRARDLPSPEEFRKRKVALISGITGQDGSVVLYSLQI